jgi:hypothetical protein
MTIPPSTSSESPARGAAGRWLNRLPTLLLIVLALATLPSLRSHVRLSKSPNVFADDARQHIFPYLQFSNPGSFDHDYVAKYFMACHPPGYRGLFTAWSRRWDPRLLSKILPYVLLAGLLIATGFASATLDGVFSAALSVAFVYFSSTFIERMMGGFPRGFGYPLLALALWALAAGRARTLVLLPAVAMAFYPVVALPAGAALGIWLLFYPPRLRGSAERWRLPVRLAALAAAALLMFVAQLSSASARAAFGRELKPSDWSEYPEAGPGGRSRVTVRGTLASDGARDIHESVRHTLIKRGDPFSEPVHRLFHRRLLARPWQSAVFLLLVILGLALRARSSAAAARLLAIVPATAGVYAGARALYPMLFQPERYAAYAIPVFLVIAMPSAVQGWANLLRRPAAAPESPSRAVTLLICTLLLLGAGGEFFRRTKITLALDEEDQAFMRFVRSLPAGSVLAGWDSTVDCIPYAGERPVFLSGETHLCYHQGYVDEMRRRFRAQTEAYFATNPAPLIDLRDRFGVTHLVVLPRHFEGRPPRYFAPFDRDLKHAAAAIRSTNNLEVVRNRERAGVFSNSKMYVLDLHRL